MKNVNCDLNVIANLRIYDMNHPVSLQVRADVVGALERNIGNNTYNVYKAVRGVVLHG